MGCGGSSKIYVANEAIRTNDTSAEAQELLATVNIAGKGSDGRVPFLQACKFGRAKMVKWMLENDNKKRISESLVDDGLLQNCQFVTNEDLIRSLVTKGGGDVNHLGTYGDTPLCLLAAKAETTTKEVLTQRRMAAVFLIETGVDFGMKNGKGLTAIQVACRDYNERMALLLAEKGASVMDVQRFMMKEQENRKNWVAGSVLAKYAFKYPKFVAGLKRQFMQLFDADGNGELDRSELTTFIAAHVKQAFKAGLMPTAEFFDDGSLEQDQIETLLESRCKDMLKGYFALDKDHDGTYSWEELLPIVQDFYTNLWTAGRPKDAENVDDIDYGADGGGGTAGAGAGATVDYGTGTVDYGAGTANYTSSTVNYGAGTKYMQSSSDLGPSAAEAITDLPHPWRAVDDPTTGAVYFYHPDTGETTWDRPLA